MADPITAGIAIVGGTVLKAVGAIKGGKATKKAKFKRAEQLEHKAGQTRASSQQDARAEIRTARLQVSRGLAVAAAGGGGINNVTVTRAIANLEAEGDYRAGVRLYSGEEEAIGYEEGADVERREGRAAKKAGWMNAASTVLSGVGKWNDQFGT